MGNYKMAHTMIRVLDLERSLKFYLEALGFEEVKRRDEPTYEFTLVFWVTAIPTAISWN